MTADGSPVTPPVVVPWWVFVPVYALLLHYPVDFESRKASHSINLTQLPLAVGVILVAPGLHLAARLAGNFIDGALIRRQGSLKVGFNMGAGAVEVGIATTLLGLLDHHERPWPALWLVLVASLVAVEVAGALTLRVVWRLIGFPFTLREAVAPLVFAVGVGAVFTGFAIVAVAALYTDSSSMLVVAALGGGLALAYRGHRRLFAQQRKTEQLYEFVKELGPVDVASSELPGLLDEVRVLLHARHLDLAVPQVAGGWTHLMSSEEGADELSPHADDALVETVARRGAPALTSTSRGRADTMSTPLIGPRNLVGILTVTERLGEIRDFDMGDLRLLETVATELTTALERGRLLADLNRAATTDSLTGLPNLAEVTRLIAEDLAGGDVLLAAVAVDSFREVNDTLGHQIGDALLREVAARLLRACPGAVVGRIGGGRFAVALSAGLAGHDPEMFGLGLRAQVEGTAQVGAIGTHVRLSVGVVRAPDHGTDAATLLRRAETAMHGAREVHGGPVIWEPAYEVMGQRRLAVVTALREALATGAIGLAFQPKIDTKTGAASGVEALARWTHPALGAIGPDEFIPLAEASGLMGSLTSSVLRQALVACKGWQRRARDVGVAVNVSADTVLDPSFVTQVAATLTAVDIEPSLLTLELTEGVVVADPALATVRLGELRALGVKISVDDFGTGYSSLTYLKGLPVDEVKIDKGFVDKLVEDPADRAVVRGVVDIAHTLGLRVVAEGVENPEQHDLLRALGVDEAQGYLHARPMPALDVAAWLRTRERLTRV
ncbi:MAG: EAL domain-containing protein [Actinobacteria bacterium]|nr:EAL domain-containing protein [Actinomycetota bacterium]MCA1722072.1 EAL domain-containing protein [Actinomycetota bacterium]